MAAVQFWTEATQHIDIACFGFFDGFAEFRADRADLSAEQLALLSHELGVPGSTYDDNDDGIHCVVTTSDADAHERQFTIGGRSALFGSATITVGEGGEGGEGGGGGEGAVDYDVQAVLGCEFHHPFSAIEDYPPPPFLANSSCRRELWLAGATGRFGLDLAKAGKPYHLELIHCSQTSIGDTRVELFGADPETPIATGVAPPDGPGPDQACLVIEVQVERPILGRLVFSSPSSKLSDRTMIFR